MERRLAKLTTGTPSLEPGVGGLPDLTAQDVAAALGFASSRVPDSFIGVHAVLARYTDSSISVSVLRKHAAKMAWSLWFDLGIETRVSRSQIDKLAEVAVHDYMQPGKFSGISKAEMARMAKVDVRTWDAGLSKVYPHVVNKFSDVESPVISMLYKVLASEC